MQSANLKFLTKSYHFYETQLFRDFICVTGITHACYHGDHGFFGVLEVLISGKGVGFYFCSFVRVPCVRRTRKSLQNQRAMFLQFLKR